MKNIYNEFINMAFAGSLGPSEDFVAKLTEVIEQKQADGTISVEELRLMLDRWQQGGEYKNDITVELSGIKEAIKELNATLLLINDSINGNTTQR